MISAKPEYVFGPDAHLMKKLFELLASVPNDAYRDLNPETYHSGTFANGNAQFQAGWRN